ncbi:MAG: GIY-YIG nuclease family protein [Acetobacteraceae bacterium]
MPSTPSPGWVYVLTNPAMPGRVKIGCTSRTPEVRAARLSDKTAVPEPFAVAWAAAVTDHRAVESIVHDRLGRCRPNANREFFTCDVATARREIERQAKALLRPWWLSALLSVGMRPRQRRSRRRHSRDALILTAAAAVVLLVVLWKPDLPDWLPSSLAHVLRDMASTLRLGSQYVVFSGIYPIGMI